jgi:hypothetical protein
MHNLLLLLVISGVCFPRAAIAQADSTTVVAGAHYRAEGLKRYFLGNDYRDLWSTPVRVEVLDLRRFAGGLRVTERGGGRQTQSLRLAGADGREYVFRSVDKAPALAQHPDLAGTQVGELIQDQTSALNPAAALVAAPLLTAAGVLHVQPRLVVMPNDPALGEFREEFAGVLGLIEERPNEGKDDEPLFAGSRTIAGTETVLEHLEETPEHRVDSRAFLTARLMDLWFNDWDRHEDQWRWARFDRSGRKIWLPIPRDRDYVFVDYDGAGLAIARPFIPRAIEFDATYPSLTGLTISSQRLDQLLLADLPKPVWDSIAVALQRRLTDAVIDSAVLHLPPEYYRLRGAELAEILKARREGLAAVADRFYARLAAAVEIHATDEAELAVIDRSPDGSVDIRIYPGADPADASDADPYYFRRFLPHETEEIRLYLHGGDDRAVVRGAAGGRIVVRVIGGGGDDVLADSVAGRGSRTALYDSRGDNHFIAGRATKIDRRPYTPRQATPRLSGVPRRDWGSSRSISPLLDYTGDVGVIVGAEVALTRYGFRKAPYARRVSLGALVAPDDGEFGLRLAGALKDIRPNVNAVFLARVSQLRTLRYYGLGNDTPELEEPELAAVPNTEIVVEPALAYEISERATISAGPVLKYVDAEARPGSPLERDQPLGTGPFGQAGARVRLLWDSRDHTALPRRGAFAQSRITAYPALLDASEPFGDVSAEASVYIPLLAAAEPTLAIRTGAMKAWGEFPFHEAAFLGGASSLRGQRSRRYAGDAMLYGNAELRSFLTRARLIVRGDLGGLVLGDAGRVYVDGASPGGWHTAMGGGLWFSFLDRAAVASVIYARGAEHRVYLRLGMPF